MGKNIVRIKDQTTQAFFRRETISLMNEINGVETPTPKGELQEQTTQALNTTTCIYGGEFMWFDGHERRYCQTYIYGKPFVSRKYCQEI